MAPLREGEHNRLKGNLDTNMNFILNVLEIVKYFALFYRCTNVFAIDQLMYKIYTSLLILIKPSVSKPFFSILRKNEDTSMKDGT